MRLVLALTGASGSIYGLRLLRHLTRGGVPVTLIPSETGRQVCRHETGIDPADPASLASVEGVAGELVTIREPSDLFAPEASGSHPCDGMVVAPCSMGTAARIAHGISSTLIERVADVMLKEGRPLILVPRETPLSTIHLETLLTLARAGGVIVPAMPAFYHRPGSVEELVDFVCGKVMDRLGIPHSLFTRWGGDRP